MNEELRRLRQELEDIKRRQRELQEASKGPIEEARRAPAAPVPRPDILGAVPPEREYREPKPEPRPDVLGAVPQAEPRRELDWWDDPAEQQAILREAQRIAREQGVSRIPTAPLPRAGEPEIERKGLPVSGILEERLHAPPLSPAPVTPLRPEYEWERGTPPRPMVEAPPAPRLGPGGGRWAAELPEIERVPYEPPEVTGWLGRVPAEYRPEARQLAAQAGPEWEETYAIREPYRLPVIGEVTGRPGEVLRSASWFLHRIWGGFGRIGGAAALASKEFEEAYAPYAEEAQRQTAEQGRYVTPLEIMSNEYREEGYTGPYLDREDLITRWRVGWEDRGWTYIFDPQKNERFEKHLERGSTVEEILHDPTIGSNLAVEFVMQFVTDPLNAIPSAWMAKAFPVRSVVKAGGRAFGLLDEFAGQVMKRIPGLDFVAQKATLNFIARYADDVLDGTRILARVEVPGRPGMSFVEKLGRMMAGDADVLSVIPKRLQPTMRDVSLMMGKSGWDDVAAAIGRGTEDVAGKDVSKVLAGDAENLGRWFAEAAARAKGNDLGISYKASGAISRGVNWTMRFLKEGWVNTSSMIGLQTSDAYSRTGIYGHFVSPFDLPVGHWLGRLVGHRPIGTEIADELAELGMPVPAELADSGLRALAERFGGRASAWAQIPIPGVGKPEATINVMRKLFGDDLMGRYPWLTDLMEPHIALTASREVIEATGPSGGMMGRALRNLNLASGLDELGELAFMSDRNCGLKIVLDTVKEGVPAAKEEFLGELSTRMRSAGILDDVVDEVTKALRQPHNISADDVGKILRRYQVEGIPYPAFENFNYAEITDAGGEILRGLGDDLAEISKAFAEGKTDIGPDVERAFRKTMAMVGDLEEEAASELLAANGGELLGPEGLIGTPDELFPHLWWERVGDVAHMAGLPEEGPHFQRSLRDIVRHFGYGDEGLERLGHKIERWSELGQFVEGDLMKGEYFNRRVEQALAKGVELPLWARKIVYTEEGQRYALNKIAKRLQGVRMVEAEWPSPSTIYQGYDGYVDMLKGLSQEAVEKARAAAEAADIPEYLRELTDEELGNLAADLDFRVRGSKEWVETFGREAREALPSSEVSRAYWSVREGEVIEDLSKAGRVTYGRMPTEKEMRGLTAEEIAKRLPRTEEAPPWDKLLQELEGRHPGFYQQLRGMLARTFGYEPGDEDVFREAIRMRNRIKSYLDMGQDAADVADELVGVDRELIRRGLMGPTEVVQRPGYIEQVRLDIPHVRALHERLGADLIERVARGDISVDDIMRGVQEGVLSPEEAESLTRVATGKGLVPTFADGVRDVVTAEAHSIRQAIRAWRRDAMGTVREGAAMIRQGADQVNGLKAIEKWAVPEWQNKVDDLVRAGVNRRNEILFDFMHRGNLDELGSTIAPFHIWQTRNVPFAIRTFSERPGLLAALTRYVDLAEEVRQMAHLPESWAGYMPLPGGSVVSKMLGMDGMPQWVDPRSLVGFGVLSQFREPFELQGKELTPVQQVATIPERMGIGLWPWWERAGRMTGVLPQAELPAGPTTWVGRVASALLGRENVEEDIKNGILAFFGIDITPTRNVIEDYYGNLRLVNMVQRGEIGYDQALQSINNADDPLFQRAYEESMDDRSKLSALRTAEPFALRTMSPERMARRMAFYLEEPGIGQYMPTAPAEQPTKGVVERILQDPGPAKHDSFLEALVMDTDTYTEYLDSYPLLTAEERATLDERWPDFTETMEDLMPYYSGEPGDLIRSRILRLADGRLLDVEGMLEEISRRDIVEGVEQRALLRGWEEGATFPSDEARQEFWRTPIGQARLTESAIWETPEERATLIERSRGFKAYELYDTTMQQVGDSLISEGFRPGTRAWRTFNSWRWEESDRIRQKYADVMPPEAEEPPIDATPEEYGAWYKERDIKAALKPYYDIEATDFADAEGAIDWDAYHAAREGALDGIPKDLRADAMAYLHRNYRPEEEAMGVVEDEVYEPLSDLMGAVSREEDPEIKKALQDQIDAAEGQLDDLVSQALADGLDDIIAMHPDWTQEEVVAVLAFDVPSFDTWARSNDDPREAMEAAFKGFYWGLPDEARRITWDAQWAQQAGVPQSYLGAEFAKIRNSDPRQLSGLADLTDEQLFEILDKVGLVTVLLEEGFPMPGVPLPRALRQIPGYEAKVRGAAEEVEAEEPEVTAAVAGEEEEGPDAAFELPSEASQAEMREAYRENAEWYAKRDAGQDPGPWTPLQEKWFGDPDSAKSHFWAAYDVFRAPEENNPLGWSLLPRELKDDPFLGMILDPDMRDFVTDEAYEEGLAMLADYVAKRGEELERAFEERRGYLAMLEPELEVLEDEYFDLGSSAEKRAYRESHPELVAYWERKRNYKDTHPLLVEYYFPGYEVTAGGQYQAAAYAGRGGGAGGRRGAGGAPREGRPDYWALFAEAAGDMIVGVLVDYWTGQGTLDDNDIRYLQALYRRFPFGVATFKEWLDLLEGMWASSGGGGAAYQIPMREQAVTIGPGGTQSGRGYTRMPPTRVRYLRS